MLLIYLSPSCWTMKMNNLFKVPPISIDSLTKPEELAVRLTELIDKEFTITGKTRTDGSNIRKLIAATLENYPLPEPSPDGTYEIVVPKKKGIPKITREFIDSYIVTSGISYNLQVWNRIPASKTLLIKLENGDSLKCNNVRFVFVKIDMDIRCISAIIILTPDYIENKFGKFGKPTIKHQLLISSKARNEIYKSDERMFFSKDTAKMSYLIRHDFSPPTDSMISEPVKSNIFALPVIRDIVAKKLIGSKLDTAATKNRGQSLERKVLSLLGYDAQENSLLFGSFPDIKNQMLEVKVQDSPTVDLGKYSPEFEMVVNEELHLTTKDVRYLIALTNPKTEIIEGIILAPGENLGDVFSFVSDQSFKCQRSIPMSFFEQFSGQVVFNPQD